MRAGRPKLQNVTRDHGGGRSRGEKPEEVMGVVLAYRKRMVGDENASNPLAGHALGRLLLKFRPDGFQCPDCIDENQFNAGIKFANIASRHARVMGYDTGSPRSPSALMVNFGMSCANEPSEAEILTIRDEFRNAFNALAEASRTYKLARMYPHFGSVATLTYDVCLDRRPFECLSSEEIGGLRIGLNALARLFRLDTNRR